MKLLHRNVGNRRRKADFAAWRKQVDDLAKQLCPREDWADYRQQQLCFLKYNAAQVRVFPVWRRYHAQAQRVLKLQDMFPVLKHFPISISAFISHFLFESPSPLIQR